MRSDGTGMDGRLPIVDSSSDTGVGGEQFRPAAMQFEAMRLGARARMIRG